MSNFQGFLNQYEKELREEIAPIDLVLLSGNILDHEEYVRLIGKRQGILFSLERHQELVSLMERNND